MKRLLFVIGLLFGSIALAQSPPGGYGPSTGSSSSGGSSTVTVLSTLPDTAHLLALNLMTDGSGNPTDASGNNNICTLAAAGAAPTWNTAAAGGGLNFDGTANQFCSYPAAVNAARTIVIAALFEPGTVNNGTYGTIINFYASYVAAQLISGSGTIGTSASLQLVQNYLSASHPGGQGAWALQSNATSQFSFNSVASCHFQGIGTVAFVMDTTDTYYVNGQKCVNYANGVATAGQQSTGVYQLGGSTPVGMPFYTGTIYAVGIWSSVLNAAQVAQASQSLTSALQQRGIQPFLGGPIYTNPVTGNADTNDIAVLEGDSLFAGINIPSQGLAGRSYETADVAISGTGTVNVLSRFAVNDLPLYHAAANRNTFVEWAGTNDCTGVTVPAATIIPAYQATARLAQNAGFKTIFATMISRTGRDLCKDTLNPLIRQYVPIYQTYDRNGIMDLGANIHLGADGASANATYFNGDQIHLQPFSSVNIVGPFYVHAINRANGNLEASGNFNAYSGLGTAYPQLLQQVDCSNLSGATITCQLPWNQSTGSLLVAVVNCGSCSGSVFPTTPTDTQADTWQAITASAQLDSTNSFIRGYYAMNATAGANTVSFTFTGTAPASAYISFEEFCCVLTAAALDVNSAIAQGTNNVPTAASITTTTSNDLVIGYGGWSAPQALGFATPIGTFWQPAASPTGVTTANDQVPVGVFSGIAPTAGAYISSGTIPVSAQGSGRTWGWASAAFKPVVSTTTTYYLQDVDVFAECQPSGANNVALVLPDGAWMTGGEITIKNIQTSGSATCTINAPTPLMEGTQQLIDGQTSLLVPNNGTVSLKSNLTFTGVAGTNQSPVIGWIQTKSNTLLASNTNCSSSASPAVCGSAAGGSFVLAAAATTVTVNTTAVTSNSQIIVIEDDSLGTKLGVTCNTATSVPEPNISARVAGTSFSILVTVAPVTNPKCYSYTIVN